MTMAGLASSFNLFGGGKELHVDEVLMNDACSIELA
jgi:hypothetical protein